MLCSCSKGRGIPVCAAYQYAPWRVGCAPANVVRGMQMRVDKLAARLEKLAVRQQSVGVARVTDVLPSLPHFRDRKCVGKGWGVDPGGAGIL